MHSFANRKAITNTKLLFQTTDDYGRNILLHSVVSLSMNGVETFLSYDAADVNISDYEGKTAMHHLAMLSGRFFNSISTVKAVVHNPNNI